MSSDVPYFVSDTIEVTTSNVSITTDDGWDQNMYFKDLTQIPWVYYSFLIISIVVIIVGLIGNMMVITVILKHRSMRTTTNYYIFSLAVSDLCITAFAMPCKIIILMSDADKSPVNVLFCCIVEFMMPYFVFTSVWTLVAISLDRYLVIVHPLRSRYFNTRARAIRNLFIIWTLPVLVFAPYFIPFRVSRYNLYSEYGVIRRSVCQHTLASFSGIVDLGYRIVQFFIIFVIPVGLLCFTCGSIAWRLLYYTEEDKMLKNAVKKEEKGRRKVAKMVLVVVVAFTLCWLPHYIVSVLAGFTLIFTRGNFIFIQVFVYTCGFINSCMNPIIYALMSKAFRKCFWGILTTCCPKYRYLVGHQKPRPGSRTQHSISEATNHSRRRQLRSAETQYTAASSDDDISMKKINHNGHHENDCITKEKAKVTEDNKEKRERLLNNLLDETEIKNTVPRLQIEGRESTNTQDGFTSSNGDVSPHPMNHSIDTLNDSVFASPPVSPITPVTSFGGQFEAQPLV